MDTVVPLSDGWDDLVPVSDSLARRFVHAYADRVTAMAARTGGRSLRVPGAVLADLGSPFGYDNAVVLTAPADDDRIGTVLRTAAGFFPPQRWWVLLSLFPLPHAPGLTPVGHPPLMFRPPGPYPPVPPGLTVRVVPDAPAEDFERVLVAGFGLADVGRPAVADPRLTGGLVHLVVGYVDGRPVATAGAAVHHGIVELDWVATLPGHRGRGYGAAVTAAACAVAPELPAVLISSDDGRPVYHRLGFWDLFRATMWEHPPQAPGT
ncbi:GNAT family N-acetyltransferase [Pseudonocardia spirodelae]|uniref:GNAT family N-acetyltransferase n=1 Tax=Pseudonocardia spirodelae TaxID=3133431 RepID=A0ABU8TCE9_9PSEU